MVGAGLMVNAWMEWHFFVEMSGRGCGDGRVWRSVSAGASKCSSGSADIESWMTVTSSYASSAIVGGGLGSVLMRPVRMQLTARPRMCTLRDNMRDHISGALLG